MYFFWLTLTSSSRAFRFLDTLQPNQVAVVFQRGTRAAKIDKNLLCSKSNYFANAFAPNYNFKVSIFSFWFFVRVITPHVLPHMRSRISISSSLHFCSSSVFMRCHA